MYNKLKAISCIVGLFTIMLIFAGCGHLKNITSETTQATFRSLDETSKTGTFQMSYEGFEGSTTKTFDVAEGDEVTFDYNSTVKAGGLTMIINDPFGTTVATLPVKKKGSVKIVAKGIGKISMVITGKNTTGSFEISWK